MATSPPRHVVMFDFDGVIADSLEHFCAAMMAAFVHIGRPELATRPQVLAFLDENWFSALAKAGVTAEERRIIDDFFEASPRAGVRPFPGMREALAKLAERHTLTIITSSRTATAQAFLEEHHIGGIADVMGSDVETSKVRKIARVLAEHGPAPRSWYVGDTVGDIVEGKQAGVTTVGVTWGWHDAERLRRAAPDYLATTPQELVGLIDGSVRRR